MQLKALPVTQSKGTEAKVTKGTAVGGETNGRGGSGGDITSKSPLGLVTPAFPTWHMTKVLPTLPHPTPLPCTLGVREK